MNKYDEKNNNSANNVSDQKKAEINQEQETVNVQDTTNNNKQDVPNNKQDVSGTAEILEESTDNNTDSEENTDTASEENANVSNVEIVDSDAKNNENNQNKQKKDSLINKIVKNRSFRYGSNSIILIAAVCAIAVLINVLAGFTDIKWDLTPNKLYSIGDETKKILEQVDKEVIIYGLFDDTKVGSNEFVELLEQYEKHPKITVKYVDPDKNPGMLKEIDP